MDVNNLEDKLLIEIPAPPPINHSVLAKIIKSLFTISFFLNLGILSKKIYLKEFDESFFLIIIIVHLILYIIFLDILIGKRNNYIKSLLEVEIPSIINKTTNFCFNFMSQEILPEARKRLIKKGKEEMIN